MYRILASVLMKLLVDEKGKLRLWGRVLPWVFMVCLALVSVAYAYRLVVGV